MGFQELQIAIHRITTSFIYLKIRQKILSMLHCIERYSFFLLKTDHLRATAHSQKRNSSDNGLHIFRVLLKRCLLTFSS